jgi:membrane protein
VRILPFLLFLVSLASVIIDPAQAQVLIQELARARSGMSRC